MTDITDRSGTSPDPLVAFDADWYLRTYPDVAQSNLDPRQHFLKFGIPMGRAPNAGGRRGAAALAAMQRTAPLPPAAGAPPDAAILLCQGIEIGRFRDLSALRAALAPVRAYQRMFPGRRPAEAPYTLRHGGLDRAFDPALPGAEARAGPVPGGAMLRTGALRIESLWFTAGNRMRGFVAGRGDADPADQPDILRLWQADTTDPGALLPVGGLTLPDDGPAFFDADLLNPLMPVLVEVAETRGFTREWALLPFPSLCPGGIHSAERTAAQSAWSPIDEVWRLSRAYLDEMLAEAPGFAVARLGVRLAGATGGETLLSRPVRDWLATVFGLGPAPDTGLDSGLDSGPDSGHADLAATLPGGAARAGRLSLSLPADMVPTIAALVSRRLDLPRGQATAAGPFLVAEAVSYKPLWSVSWPLDPVRFGTAEGQPVLTRPGPARGADPASTGTGTGAAQSWLAPLHLGIALRPPRPVDDILRLMPVAPDAPRPAASHTRPALTVAITVSDPGLSARFLSSLACQDGLRIAEILLCPDTGAPAPPGAQDTPRHDPRAEILAVADGLFPGRCRWLRGGANPARRLDALREEGTGAQILIADQATLLYAPDTVAGLQDLLARDPDAASIAAALLHEAAFKKDTRLQTGGAGIFPSHVSFAAAPRLAVAEPDPLDALPRATYPVIANGFGLCLIRPEAIEATRAGRAQGLAAAADLQFGLDAFAAGWRSLCSTQVRAGTTRPPARRDEIDPLGLACLLPARWDDLLSRVTVLRELRG